MSPEISLVSRVIDKVKGKRHESSEEAVENAKRVVSTSLQLLEGAPLDSYKGRRVTVKVPHSKHVFRITDISETDHTKEQIAHGDSLVLSHALRIQPLKPLDLESWVHFPLPYLDTITEDYSNLFLWRSGTNFSNAQMQRLAERLERAVVIK